MVLVSQSLSSKSAWGLVDGTIPKLGEMGADIHPSIHSFGSERRSGVVITPVPCLEGSGLKPRQRGQLF
jgi:hypothetical protein